MIWSSKQFIKNRIEQLRGTISRDLVIVQFRPDPVIDSFVSRKSAMAKELGVRGIHLTAEVATEREARAFIEYVLGAHPTAGIILQLPFPPQWDTRELLDLLPPNQDIDVLSRTTYIQWLGGQTTYVPPVARAVSIALRESGIELRADIRVVVVGQGMLVGQPSSDWFTLYGHTHDTIDIETDDARKRELLAAADVVISGTGKPWSITPDLIKQNAVLIDCGTSSDNGTLRGDIHPDCADKALFITKTPGGIGPLTVLSVFENLAQTL